MTGSGGGTAVAGETGRRTRDLLTATAIVLALRVLYLVRHGWDGCWMNYNFLFEAKGYALGQIGEAHGLPLTPLFVWALRGAGLGPLAALGVIYLCAQALFTISALVLFRFFSGTLGGFPNPPAMVRGEQSSPAPHANFVPGASRRRELLFVVALAAIPMLSADTGYKDLAVTLGAGLLLAALACALPAGAARRWRPGLLVLAVIAAALGGACRTESLAATGAGALLLALAGFVPAARAEPLPRRRAAALALAAGTALGVVLAIGLARWLRGVGQLGAPTYSFYTFSDGLPWLMRSAGTKVPGEYGRYLASIDIFGNFAANHGSVATALRAHPGQAFLRFALKLPDLIAGAVGLRAITPVGALLALVGLLGGARVGGVAARPRAFLLLAFLGPVAVLMLPPSSDFYFLAALFPVLLAIAAGLDVAIGPRPERTVRRLVGAAIVATAVLIATVGRTERSTSPVINEAARSLESECHAGCLMNYLPPSLASQAWANLEAGAPFPEKVKRSEAFVTGHYPRGYQQGCAFGERVRRARAAGYRGPVLYADVRIPSTRVFSAEFDPEHRFEGAVDLSGATLRHRFEDRGDVISIYDLPNAP
ncbi:MAG TPA: hypothetical protein VKQ32_22380 [Polyangia bacterium]|nr:hypothetical protein [Polyangia bacterium]